ncbi:MAG: amidohydrolase family protein, partial [Planctomycetes bacterium]|nr:amidohydrolase family protein [Planctomycetota bacterium]
ILKAAVGATLTSLGPARAAAAQAQEAPGARPAARHRIVDVHNHPYWLGHNPRKMVENMDRCGIERTWLLSWEVPEDEISPGYYATLNPLGIGIPFSDVVRSCEQFPDQFVAGYAIDPRRPYAREKLRSAVAIHGVRVYGELKLRAHYDDPDFIAMYRLCGDLRLPVLFHLDVVLPPGSVQTSRQWWYGGDLDRVERALEVCPDTVFIGHSPGFWREISGDAGVEPLAYPEGKPIRPGGKILKLLEKHPNFYCDLSAGSGHTALSRDLEFTRRFLVEHQDRCLFGRDDVDTKLHDLLISLALPDEALAKILSSNAYRLVPAPQA